MIHHIGNGSFRCLDGAVRCIMATVKMPASQVSQPDPLRHAENEEVGYAGWQLACLLACGATSFDIALTEHVTSAGVRDQPALIRLLTGLEDLDGFLTKLQQCVAGWRKTGHEQFQL